nr:diguanylate cyclase [Pseudoxanthomonas gei]
MARLGRDLAALHREEHECHAPGLQAANEKLVIAALEAAAVADKAKQGLAGLVASSQRDELTNTPNRALTLERLEHAIGLARRHDTLMAVLFLDLDHLKLINDSLGHSAGDAALQLTARRLESIVRSTDTVSRHGGDEFVVVLSELKRPSDAAELALQMLEALAIPTCIGGHVLSLTASIGISIFPLDAATGPHLIEIADSAMYVVKRLGGSQFAFDPANEIAGNVRTQDMSGPPRRAVADRAGMAQLRLANEQLVVAALAAHELKDLADEARGKEIKFMAMVAHELRSPLTPIQLAADMLSLNYANETKLKKLQAIIGEEVEHLVYLIEDLLDASRISTGKLRMEQADVDLGAVLAQAVHAKMSNITERDQTIEATLTEEPVVVRGSKVRLKQIFSNLLDNASKYTPVGGHIELGMTLTDNEVTVVVADNGIGIPAHALPHIFDLFVQEAGALSLHGGGLGIGLALVHELVAAHHGTVSARSAGRNQGSRFTVVLPCLGTPPSAAADGGNETG